MDRLSWFPDSLLLDIQSKMSTHDSVCTSILSKPWINRWSKVPVLDLDSNSFRDDADFVSFVSKFLERSEGLKIVKLIYDINEHDDSSFKSWIDSLVKLFNRGVCHLDLQNRLDDDEVVNMPLSLYSLVRLGTLSLQRVVLDRPGSVKLSSLKILYLDMVRYNDDSTLENLISNCPVLEELTVILDPNDSPQAVCVRSRSVRSFKLESECHESNTHTVTIDAPRLECMTIEDHQVEVFSIHNISSCAKVDIDVTFNLDKEEIRKFLIGLSTVGEMTISAETIKVVEDFFKTEQLPKYWNMTHLHAYFQRTSWEMLPNLLESCPILKSLVLEFDCLPEVEHVDLSHVPSCFSSSLEFVHLKAPDVLNIGEPRRGASSRNKIAKYFTENASAIKKLTMDPNFC